MSVKISSMVFESGPDDLAQHSVMIALADNADDNGVAWPGQELLARKSRMSERNLIRVLSALECDGWLVKRQRRQGEHRRGNVYELNMARLAGRIVAKAIPDTVSPHARERAAKAATSESSGDTVSPQHRLPAGEVTSAQREVTLSASRGDMGLADLLLAQRDDKQNHQEPSTKPSSTPPVSPASGGALRAVLDPSGESKYAIVAGERVRFDSGAVMGGEFLECVLRESEARALSAEDQAELDQVNTIRANRRDPPLTWEQWVKIRDLPPVTGAGVEARGRRPRWRSGRVREK